MTEIQHHIPGMGGHVPDGAETPRVESMHNAASDGGIFLPGEIVPGVGGVPLQPEHPPRVPEAAAADGEATNQRGRRRHLGFVAGTAAAAALAIGIGSAVAGGAFKGGDGLPAKPRATSAGQAPHIPGEPTPYAPKLPAETLLNANFCTTVPAAVAKLSVMASMAELGCDVALLPNDPDALGLWQLKGASSADDSLEVGVFDPNAAQPTDGEQNTTKTYAQIAAGATQHVTIKAGDATYAGVIEPGILAIDLGNARYLELQTTFKSADLGKTISGGSDPHLSAIQRHAVSGTSVVPDLSLETPAGVRNVEQIAAIALENGTTRMAPGQLSLVPHGVQYGNFGTAEFVCEEIPAAVIQQALGQTLLSAADVSQLTCNTQPVANGTAERLLEGRWDSQPQGVDVVNTQAMESVDVWVTSDVDDSATNPATSSLFNERLTMPGWHTLALGGVAVEWNSGSKSLYQKFSIAGRVYDLGVSIAPDPTTRNALEVPLSQDVALLGAINAANGWK